MMQFAGTSSELERTHDPNKTELHLIELAFPINPNLMVYDALNRN